MKEQANNFSEYSALSSEDVLARLQTSIVGLDDNEAAQRLERYGKNTIKTHGVAWFTILYEQCTSPFIYLLFFVALASFFLNSTLEGIVIIVILLLNVLLGFFQEFKAEKTAHMLKSLLTPTVKVLRAGAETQISAQDVVPGDILVLYPGDILAADVRFVQTQKCTVDESALTGESIPVKKDTHALAQGAQDFFDATNIGFAGTTLLTGKALAVVFACASASSLGLLALRSNGIIRTSSVSKIVGRFSTFILWLTLASLALVLVVHIVVKSDHNYLELLLFASALAVSVVPEALPLVTTFGLSNGARRLAHKKAVVKRLTAIEDLGNIEILCTDKTGTLTENILQITSVYGTQERQTLVYAALVGGIVGGDKRAVAKGFDLAITQALTPQEKMQVHNTLRLGEIPFDPARLRSVLLMQQQNKNYIIVRGAPEFVIAQCQQITAEQRQSLDEWIEQEGNKGNRVLAVGVQELNQTVQDVTVADEHAQLEFIGMISFADPIKKSAAQAVKKAQDLGLELKMLSGDSIQVCTWVAQQLGIISGTQKAITGAEFMNASDEERLVIVQNYHVFARVSPEHKYHIIKLLQQTRDVGYMGDGINDVLALKEAHVGLAVYDAVDVAREAADIILLQKSLMVIVEGVQEGRRVFANTLKYLRITMAINFGNFYSISVAALILDFLPMLPVQILLVNLLTDLPLVALATDTVPEDELQRPASYDVKGILILSTFLGLISSIFDFIYFALFWQARPIEFQTGWFILNICTEMLFLFSTRTPKLFLKAKFPSLSVIALVVGVTAITLTLPYTHFGNEFFDLTPLKIHNLLLVLAIAGMYFVVSEILKLVYYHRSTKK